MKTNVRKFFVASMLMTAALFTTSCSSDDDSIFTEPQAEPEAPVIHFRAQLGAKNGDNQNGAKAQRRVVTDKDTYLDADWQVDEEVALIYKYETTTTTTIFGFPIGSPKTETHIVKDKVTVTELSGDAAIVEGYLTGSPTDGTEVRLVYPYAAADESQTDGVKASNLATNTQDGTIDGENGISKIFDVAVGDGNLAVSTGSNEASLQEMATLHNIYAMLKLSFKDANNVAIDGISNLTIKNNANGNVLAKVRGGLMNSIYVAMEPINTNTVVSFTAISTSGVYSGTASLSSLVASMFYRSTLKLNATTDKGAVDPGLSSGLLWAAWNIGATKPEEYGDFFAWGETTGYTSSVEGKTNTGTDYTYYGGYTDKNFQWKGYEWADQSYTYPQNHLTKYNFTTAQGTVDNKYVLDDADDAAIQNWGGSWRMPVKSDWDELFAAYPASTTSGSKRSAWVDDYKGTGVAGLAFYDASDNIIMFLPAAGHRYEYGLSHQGQQGRYWSKSLSHTDPHWGEVFHFKSTLSEVYYDGRDNGLTIRPVYVP